MGISDRIEAFIYELMKNEQSDFLELGRNELAEIFDCVPSQINYVLNTRFNSERGYIVESKRGGGGYLRIYRLSADDRLSEILSELGKPQNEKTCKRIINILSTYDIISEREARIMKVAVSGALEDDFLRSKVLKSMIYSLRRE